MKTFYAYENWSAQSSSSHDVIVHMQECTLVPSDTHGARLGTTPSGTNDHWRRLGIFEFPRDAMKKARELAPRAKDFRYCDNCLSSTNEE